MVQMNQRAPASRVPAIPRARKETLRMDGKKGWPAKGVTKMLIILQGCQRIPRARVPTGTYNDDA